MKRPLARIITSQIEKTRIVLQFKRGGKADGGRNSYSR